MGIYANRGLEYMFQFRMALPLNLLAMVSEKGLYQPEYFPDVNRLLVIPMKETDQRLVSSKYYKDHSRSSNFKKFTTTSHCLRVDSRIDIQLSPEEQAFIDKIADTPGIQQILEHHGWYDNNYVWCTMDNTFDSPHKKKKY